MRLVMQAEGKAGTPAGSRVQRRAETEGNNPAQREAGIETEAERKMNTRRRIERKNSGAGVSMELWKGRGGRGKRSGRAKRVFPLLALLIGWVALGAGVCILSSCAMQRGYRDQAQYALSMGGEKGEGRRRDALSADAIRLDEFLSSYSFDLPAEYGKTVTARLLLGGSGSEREEGIGYLMLALSAKPLAPDAIPPRHWVIGLDGSYSMKDGEKWTLMTAAARRLVARLRSQDRVTLFAFGRTMRMLAEEAAPDTAAASLSQFADAPDLSSDDHAAGLQRLGSCLLDVGAKGGAASGFFLTDMEGAAEDLPVSMEKLCRLGLDINVIGLAGGNETLLRQLARSASGSYVFLADKGDIDRTLGEDLSKTFDAVARNVTVSLWFDKPLRLEAAENSEWMADCYSHLASEERSPLVLATIPRLGPGETWVRLWRLRKLKPGGQLALHARVQGTDAGGRSFHETATLAPGYLTPSGVSREEKALLKGVTIARQVQILREALGGGIRYGAHPFSQVMAEVKAVAREVREAQAILNDPEFARDLEALEAASKLTEADVARWRREGFSCRSGRLPLPFRIVGLPFFVIGFLLFG